ncbi:MAG TPA: hypothetical protein GXZ90_05960 [Clostridiales bacterium]|nr:hypothetical protein [Clostridiales bacterium]
MDYFKSKNANRNNDDIYIKEIAVQKQELYKERQKLLDEKTDMRKLLRDDARLEHRIDILETELKKQGLRKFEPHYSSINQSDNDLVVMLSDLHIGAEYYSFTGTYNSNIAKERLEEYLGSIIEIKELHGSENCFITILGDSISGTIHKSIAVANRENVIEQTKLVSELICNFVFELSKHFNQVYVNAVSGNHSRLERKEDAVKDERLDSITPWFIKNKLDHVKNVYVELDELDSTIATMSVRDNIYLSLHGDYDAFNDGAVAKLVLWLGFRPNVIMFGHKHHPAMSEVAGITTVQCGSLAGSGDDYTIQKRLKGNASQTILVCDTGGVRACYPIKFD